MRWIDTHTHLYVEEFDNDRKEVVEKAISLGVELMITPCIDMSSFTPMQELCEVFPQNLYPTIGLHPTSVTQDYKNILDKMEEMIPQQKWIAIGEIGLDFYWDTSMAKEQEDAFVRQIEWAVNYNLPILIHCRKSLDRTIELIKPNINKGLKGVFHCFPGDVNHAKRIVDMGFKIGIGGVVTFKNASMAKVVEEIDLSNIVLETDSPYLAPSPYRGKRNESAYIPIIGNKIAEIKKCELCEVASKTTAAAIGLFKL